MQRKIKDLSKQDRRFIAEYIKQAYLPEKLGFDKLSQISECFAKSYDQLNDSAEAKMLAGQQGLQKLKQKFIKVRLDKIKEMIDDCFENKENLDIEYICDYVFNYDDRVEFIKEERNKIKVEKQQEKTKEIRKEKASIMAKEERQRNRLIHAEKEEITEIIEDKIAKEIKPNGSKLSKKDTQNAMIIANDFAEVMSKLSTPERLEMVSKIKAGSYGDFLKQMAFDGIIRMRQGETITDLDGNSTYIAPSDKNLIKYMELAGKLTGEIKPQTGANIQINNLFGRNKHGILSDDDDIKDVR